MQLLVAGNFVTDGEKEEFDLLMKTPEVTGSVEYVGFVSGAEKTRAMNDADLFCFPTRYLGENQPVNLIEAMAFGLPIVTTRWRSLPEMLPADYPGLVATQSPDEIAGALLMLARQKTGENLRENFLAQFTLNRHLTRLGEAIRSVETDTPASVPKPVRQAA